MNIRTGITTALVLIAALGVCSAANPGDAADARRGGSVNTGKAAAPIDISHLIAGKPRAGATIHVELALTPRDTLGELTLELSAEDGLELAGPRHMRLGPVAAGDPQRVPLELTVLDEGLHYLHVVAVSERAGVRRMRSYAVPLQAGALTRRKSSGRLDVDAAGEPIVSLPARER